MKRKKKWLRVHSHRRKVKEIWKGFWGSDEKLAYLVSKCLQVKKRAPKIVKKKLSVLSYRYYTAYLLRHKVDDKTILIESLSMEKTLQEICFQEFFKELKDPKYKMYPVYVSMKE